MANGQHRRIEAVGFDAMFTIFQPKMGSRAELNAQVFADVAGVRADPAELDALLQRLRSAQPRHRSVRMEDYWSSLNATALRILDAGRFDDRSARRLGRTIHIRTVTDPTLYTVRPEMRELLLWLRERVTIAIASNQHHRALLGHLRAADLLTCFGKHVYTSEHIRSPKPSNAFWSAVLRGVRASSYAAFAYVGNSVENDIPLARERPSPVALLDLARAIPGLAVAGVSVVHDEVELREWSEHLLHRHDVPADHEEACFPAMPDLVGLAAK